MCKFSLRLAREGLVEDKGFFILPSELFCNVRKTASEDENLNETLERVFRHIEESAKGSQSENSFAGLFDDYDVNSNKLVGLRYFRFLCVECPDRLYRQRYGFCSHLKSG